MNNKKEFLRVSDDFTDKYKLSQYNIYLDAKEGLVYNTVSQAVATFETKTIDDEVIEACLENGFVVNRDLNELYELKKEYDCRNNLSDTFHLIIAVTLDCQFRCFYCYENHPAVYMEDDIKTAIVELIEKKASDGKNISVVWYGGEPLLDYKTIRALTYRFEETCHNNKVKYTASMITNGYLFDNSIISQIDDLCIENIQITLDGTRDVHEKRRPQIDKRPSFDKIIENIIKLEKETQASVKLRINVDKSNISSAQELIVYCKRKDLCNIDVTLGMMKTFGCDHSCSDCTESLFSMKEFSNEFLKFRKQLKELGFEKAVEKMRPEYKVNSCTMDSPDAYVIDPKGYMYKCISLVGDDSKSIGNIKDGFDENSHEYYSPFTFKTCSKCAYFPICKGGCLRNNSRQGKECNIWKFITEKLVLDLLDD